MRDVCFLLFFSHFGKIGLLTFHVLLLFLYNFIFVFVHPSNTDDTDRTPIIHESYLDLCKNILHGLLSFCRIKIHYFVDGQTSGISDNPYLYTDKRSMFLSSCNFLLTCYWNYCVFSPIQNLYLQFLHELMGCIANNLIYSYKGYIKTILISDDNDTQCFVYDKTSGISNKSYPFSEKISMCLPPCNFLLNMYMKTVLISDGNDIQCFCHESNNLTLVLLKAYYSIYTIFYMYFDIANLYKCLTQGLFPFNIINVK